MGGWNGVYTQQGLSLLSRLSKGGTLNITRAVTGTGLVSEADLSKQTKIAGEKQELSFQTPSYPEQGTCKLPVTLTNKGITVGYTAHQIGFYATDPTKGEILYFIAQSENGTNVLPETDISGYAATWTFYFKYGQADNVTVTVDPANTVTFDMLEEVRILAERGVSDQGRGAVIMMENTANLPFSGLNVYGKSTQSGTPTPAAPVDIVSVGDSGNVKIHSHGKNILCGLTEAKTFSDDTYSISFNPNSDGSITVNGTTGDGAISFTIVHKALPIGTYILSGSSENTRVVSMLKYKDGTAGYFTSFRGSTVQVPINDEVTQHSVYIEVKAGATITNEVMHPMLRLQNTEGTFEKYTGQTATVATPNGLCGIPVTSGGNYTDMSGQQWICDEIDLVRGVYVQRVGRVILDSAVTYYYDDANLFFHTEAPLVDSVAAWEARVISDRLVSINKTTMSAYNWVQFGSGKDIRFKLEGITTLDALAEWLAENSISVIYPLAEPIETSLSVETLRANNPTTTIINDSGAEMAVDCIRDVNEKAFGMVLQNAGSAPKSVKVTLTADGWTMDSDTDMYTQTVAAEGITETMLVMATVDYSGIDAATCIDIQEAWYMLDRIAIGNGQIEAICFDEPPTYDIPLVLEVLR